RRVGEGNTLFGARTLHDQEEKGSRGFLVIDSEGWARQKKRGCLSETAPFLSASSGESLAFGLQFLDPDVAVGDHVTMVLQGDFAFWIFRKAFPVVEFAVGNQFVPFVASDQHVSRLYAV